MLIWVKCNSLLKCNTAIPSIWVSSGNDVIWPGTEDRSDSEWLCIYSIWLCFIKFRTVELFWESLQEFFFSLLMKVQGTCTGNNILLIALKWRNRKPLVHHILPLFCSQYSCEEYFRLFFLPKSLYFLEVLRSSTGTRRKNLEMEW